MENLFKITRFNKISGINLIGLMIASALGAFILAVIVRVSFTVSNNFQIIKSTSELEASARLLNSFFGKALLANGYNNTDVTHKLNTFYINPTATMANFTLWYAGSIDGSTQGIDSTILCSGQPAPTNSATPIPITIFLKKPASVNSMDGYVTCTDSSLPPSLNSTTIGAGYMPLVSRTQVADFYVASVVSNTTIPANMMASLGVTSGNTYNSVGIKLAILLRTTIPVFTVNRTVQFQNIFNQKTFGPYTDKYLYKLVIIQSPFIYTTSSTVTDSSQNTKAIISN